MSADESDSDLEVFKNLLPPDQNRSAIEEKRTLLGLQAPLPAVPGSPAVRTRGKPTSDGADEAPGPGATPSPGGGSETQVSAEREPVNLDDWATSRPAKKGQPKAREPGKPSSKGTRKSRATSLADADAGWEDDDDKTTIYGPDGDSGAQDLLRPRVAPAAQPPPPMSRPPGAMLPPTPDPRKRPHASQDTAFIPVGAPNGGPPWMRYAVATALVSLVLLTVFLLRSPSEGSLHVTVTGPGNRAIPGVEVLINGKLRCDVSPCEVPKLKAGTYLVLARAPGYQATGEIAVDVSGAQSVKNITLERFVGTGIHVLGKGSGLILSVDGQETGPLPQAIRDMAPGEHVIEVTGGDRYADFTQRVSVEEGRMTTVGPVRLRVVRGLATIVAGPGSEGADATLLVDSTRKVLPALPIKLEVDTSRSHVLVARKDGHVSFRQPIVFDDGQAERTIELTLPSETRERRATTRRTPLRPAEAPQSAGAPAPALSTLSLVSTPPSSVVLDGQPLGSTPQKTVQVEPGNHNVLFIHGSERIRREVVVTRGKQATVAVEF